MSSTENKKFTFDDHLVFCDIRTQFPLRQVLLEPTFHSGKRVARDFISINFRVSYWTRETLVHRLITTHIQPGTVIYSDQFTPYIPLNQLGYIHVSVNHSKNFVDPDSGAHTNTIEGCGLWSRRSWSGCVVPCMNTYPATWMLTNASVVCWWCVDERVGRRVGRCVGGIGFLTFTGVCICFHTFLLINRSNYLALWTTLNQNFPIQRMMR